MNSEAKGTLLLEALDALVKADTGVPGFAATIAIGVDGPIGPRWWIVALGARAEAGLADVVPPNADVALLLGERGALGLLSCGDPGEAPISLFGDARVLQRFMGRYLSKQGTIALRAALSAEVSRARRRY